jgi:23S rRNA (cytosine1962-C5)-methyltransferase
MKQVPARSAGVVKVVLKSGKDASLHRYHPWVFSGAIKKIYGLPLEGDVVDVYDNHDNPLGSGHFQPGSIAVRMLSFTRRSIDRVFFY